MYQLFVEEHFDAAHYLPDYHGKCERLHGHTFKVVLRAEGATVGADGMAYDFAEMKRHLRETLQTIDHTCINDVQEFAGVAPSSENIASWLFDQLQPRFEASPLRLAAIEVWESPTAGVVYTP